MNVAEIAIMNLKLRRTWYKALKRIYLRGPDSWHNGTPRKGGAVYVMFRKLKSIGYCDLPAFTITDKGKRYVDTCETYYPQWKELYFTTPAYFRSIDESLQGKKL